MFIYICQIHLISNLQKKLNNWNLEKVYLVVCGCLLVVCGCLLLIYGRLLVICGRLLIICGRLLVICGCLLVVCDRLCLFVAVACFSNYDVEIVRPGVKWILWRVFSCRAVGRKKLCMVPYHSCYICGTWRSKQVTKGVSVFLRGVDPSRNHEGGSHYVVLLF